MRGRPMTIGALLVASAALTGCVPQPVATPTPTPTYACTPEAGGAEYRCDQRDYEAMKAKDALYAEAWQVYERLSKERDRLYREGLPADDATVALTTGDATEQVRAGHHNTPKLTGGDVRVSLLHRNPGLVRGGSVVSLDVCRDASELTIASGPDAGAKASVWIERVYFIGPSGGLRLNYFESKKVATC